MGWWCILWLTMILMWTIPGRAGEAPGAQPGDGTWALEGRAYYLLADHFTCRTSTPERTYIKSWKNKLTFTRGQVLVWQTLCNDSPLVMEFAEHAFTFAADLLSLTYEQETYTYYAQPPQLCAQGQWCPVATPEGQDGAPPAPDSVRDTPQVEE